MTNPLSSQVLLELAERCERATGPDQRLDAEIVAALNNAMLKPYPPQTDFGPGQRWQFWSLDGVHFLGNEAKHPFKVSLFTASLDAAMSLVPEGWRVENLSEWDADCLRKNGPWMSQVVPLGDATHKRVVTCQHAAIPALALCAAALRARAVQTQETAHVD